MYVHLQHHAYEDHGSYKQAVFIQVSTSGRRGHALRPRNRVLLRRFLTSTSTGSTPTTSTRALDFVKLRHDSARCRAPTTSTATTSTTSRAAPPSSDHQTTRPRPERLRRAPTTRPRRNDDRHEERRYDNHDHRHNMSKSTRIGQLHHRRPDFYPKISTLLIFIINTIFITTFLHK